MPLALIGTPIGNLGDLSPRVVETLRIADVIACEDTRRTRKLLSHAGIPAGGRLRAVHEHNELHEAARIVGEVREGLLVALATDAGMPGVSDPGARVVAACRAAGLPVTVVPGPSAALAALALSGFSADRFVFEGFLPRKGKPRAERVGAIAAEVRTVVVFEAPGRVAATLADLAAACGDERWVCLARELTKQHEESWLGELGVAARLATVAEPRGEHVIVLGDWSEIPVEVTDSAVERAVRDALARGLSARDTAAEVAGALGVPKRRAYELAVSLRSR